MCDEFGPKIATLLGCNLVRSSSSTTAFSLTDRPGRRKMMGDGVLVFRRIPSLENGGRRHHLSQPFASISSAERASCGSDDQRDGNGEKDPIPSYEQLLSHPMALLGLVPNNVALFSAGAIAGAAAKTLTAPLDRVKLLMQTHALRVEGGKKGIGFLEAFTFIGNEEGVKGYWKGNLPQVVRIIPYSAVQLLSYEVYKKLFGNKEGKLSVIGRLLAGACAGMTSTFVTYPLDVLRLRLAVETGSKTMPQVALSMLREEGFASFYTGLGPSLISIAPYIAVNFCVFDL
ncbi:Thylakoid ADP,ATP carrier protein, chloroplastic [Apostasia shenzhenica]|uniref:Thylakoid ADP,ATP carrier protein, chloroplastic n=1 Tax=Apostasia shenzhenica TaxID=1088818 RepID=A0A2I0A8Y3_9ASPA|nr:Thylakoid ADP,ATP carrier protein, chloroplastic [Apostasia shenzhenica]